MTQVFDLPALTCCACFGALAFVLTTIVRAAKGDGAQAPKRGAESAVLAFIGSGLARLFLGSFLYAAGSTPEATVALGWGFFLWPGVIDALPWLCNAALPIGAEHRCWIASATGGFVGMMDGMWATHDGRVTGALSFLLDVTWGLAGSTNGCLLHLFNFAWAGHAPEPAPALIGFRIKKGFAFTQGAVMSNLQDAPDSDLFRHERLHVWQNRIFGPFFTLGYLGWMAVLFFPSLIPGAASGRLRDAIEWWAYFDNPWEAWAYQIGGWRQDPNPVFCWTGAVVVAVSVPFFLGILAASAWVISGVW